MASPTIELKSKKSMLYKNTVKNELDLITYTYYMLYLSKGFVVIMQEIYAFNHFFESLFDLEKTMSRVKNLAIEKMIDTNALSNAEEFKHYSSQYKSLRTFITLGEDRLRRLRDKRSRARIATMLKVPLNEEGFLNIMDYKMTSLLIRYLCYKIFQDSETDDVLEATTISRIEISR
jgi:hypothetical protein